MAWVHWQGQVDCGTPEARGADMANGRLARSRVGVLGSGEVGRRLAAGFCSRGDDVMIGSRDPDKPLRTARCSC